MLPSRRESGKIICKLISENNNNYGVLNMFIQAGEHLIHTISFGKGGIPFVAHGGWIGSWELWEQPLESLSMERRCIALDHLGSGESPLPTGIDLTLEMLVKSLKQVLDTLEVEHCILAGESSGSKVVLQFALTYPEMVKALVLEGFAFAVPESKTQGQVNSIMKDYDGYVRTFVKRCLPGSKSHFIRWGNNILRRASKEDAIALLQVNSTVDLTSRLAEIKIPTLVLHGEKDEIIPIATGEQLNRLIPNSTLVIIPNAGHVPTITHSELVSDALGSFLTSLE